MTKYQQIIVESGVKHHKPKPKNTFVSHFEQDFVTYNKCVTKVSSNEYSKDTKNEHPSLTPHLNDLNLSLLENIIFNEKKNKHVDI